MLSQNDKILPIFFIFFSLVLFSSCSQKKPAKIVIKGDKFYGKDNKYNGYVRDNVRSINGQKQNEFVVSRDIESADSNKNDDFKKDDKETPLKTNAPKINELKSNDAKSNEVKIVAGDTVYSVSRAHNIPISDLIKQNNLAPPYNLKIGSKIIIPKSQYHLVVNGETLYSIAKAYGMNVSDLVKFNKLSKPYKIKVGDYLKVSGDKIFASKKNVVSNAVKAVKAQQVKFESKNQTKINNFENKDKKEISKPDEDSVYSKEPNNFSWPVKGKIISNFGPKSGGLYNDGINIKGKIGDPVKSTEDGVVAYVGNELRGYGNLIIIKHKEGWISAYAHLNKAKVNRGDKVKKGEIIAELGSTGNINSPQLYFGLRKGRNAVNPEIYLNDPKKSSSNKKRSEILKIKLKDNSN